MGVMKLPTCLSEVFHEKTESLGPGEEVVLENWVAPRASKVHAHPMFLLCESCSLSKETQLGTAGGRTWERGDTEREREGKSVKIREVRKEWGEEETTTMPMRMCSLH